MEQYRQLARHGHYRSLLGIFPTALRKLQPPSPQITFPVRVYQDLRFVRSFDPRQGQQVMLAADQTPS
jgi:hypothetical protein